MAPDPDPPHPPCAAAAGTGGSEAGGAGAPHVGGGFEGGGGLFPQRDGFGAGAVGFSLGGGGDRLPLLVGVVGRFVAELPRGFFLKSFRRRSRFEYVFDPQANPSGVIPIGCCLGVALRMKRNDA